MPDAGWYRDPQDPSVEEYWDGQAWSGSRRPSSDSAYGPQGGAPQAGPAVPPWGQRPVYGPPSYGASGYGAQQDYATPAPTRRRKAALIIAGVVVVVLVAAGVVAFLLRSSSSPKITYAGKEIASAGAPLTTAEKAVDTLVAKQHGAKSGGTRCYYAQQATPAKGTKASDVIDSLRCGPVLFVDGNPAEEYLSVPLDADTSGKQVALTPETGGLSSDSLSAVPGSLTLVRPDDATAPSGNGGLSVPKPPPAAKDSILATALTADEAPSSILDSSMLSKDQGVRLLGAGYISQYGSGATARSAPAGQRLVAFQVSTGEGAIGSGGPEPTLVVDGRSLTIPIAFGNDWDVAAVPSGSKPVIQLKDDGFTQSLSLPGGAPGSGNIAVLTRSNTLGLIGKDFTMHTTFEKDGGSVDATLSVTANTTNLYFWSPRHPQYHPSNPDSAFLSVDLTFTDSTSPGKTFAFDRKLLSLQLPNGSSVHPRNLAHGTLIYNVFAVPADFTSGRLVIGGAANIGNGVHQSLKSTKTLSIKIAK